MGEHSEQALSEAEKAQGKILMCCTTAQSDISINIPGYNANALPVRTLPARIESMVFKHDVALLKLALPKAPPFAFYAGQYIDLLLPGNISRSYSIANSPDQEGILELHIRRRENGVCSEMIFGSEPKVKEKGIVRIKGPLGSFTLQEDSGKPIILLATGTGYAPIRSILLDLIRQDSSRAVHFYWGARHQDDLYALEEAQELTGRLKNIIITVALFTLSSLVAQSTLGTGLPFILAMTLMTFGFTILGAVGLKYRTFAFGALAVATYTTLTYTPETFWLTNPVMILLGTVLYSTCTLVFQIILPHRPVQESVANAYRSATADILTPSRLFRSR